MEKHLYYYPNHTTFESSTDLKNIHNVVYCENELHVHYDYHDYSKDYFTIINVSSQNATITITKTANATNSTSPLLDYSITNDNERVWQHVITADMEVGISGIITLAPGSKMVLKGTVSGDYSASAGPFSFKSNKDIKVEGNIMSLINGDNFTNSNTLSLIGIFSSLFKNNTHLIDASNLILPATTLTNYCYVAMFNGCSYLAKAPKLPATSLALSCYECMFLDCTNLTTSPELLAETLAEYCYRGMFLNCTNLSSITCLATNISALDCVYHWVYGISSTGTFIKAASMNTWTTGGDGIPTGWTVQNASN